MSKSSDALSNQKGITKHVGTWMPVWY